MTRSACTSCSARAGTFRIRRPNGAGESWMREIRTSGLTSSDRKRSDGLVFWRKPPANGHSPEPTATAPVADSTAQQYRRYELQFASGVPAGVAHEQHSVGGGDDGAADLFEMGLCINALTWVSANGITTAAPVPRSRRRTDRCSGSADPWAGARARVLLPRRFIALGASPSCHQISWRTAGGLTPRPAPG